VRGLVSGGCGHRAWDVGRNGWSQRELRVFGLNGCGRGGDHGARSKHKNDSASEQKLAGAALRETHWTRIVPHPCALCRPPRRHDSVAGCCRARQVFDTAEQALPREMQEELHAFLRQ